MPGQRDKGRHTCCAVFFRVDCTLFGVVVGYRDALTFGSAPCLSPLRRADGPAEQLPAHGPEGGKPHRQGVLDVVPVPGVPHKWPQGSAPPGAGVAGGARVSGGSRWRVSSRVASGKEETVEPGYTQHAWDRERLGTSPMDNQEWWEKNTGGGALTGLGALG